MGRRVCSGVVTASSCPAAAPKHARWRTNSREPTGLAVRSPSASGVSEASQMKRTLGGSLRGDPQSGIQEFLKGGGEGPRKGG